MESLRTFLVCLCLVAAVRLSIAQSSEQNLKTLLEQMVSHVKAPESTAAANQSVSVNPSQNNTIEADYDVITSEQPIPAWTQGCDWTELVSGKSNRFDCCATVGVKTPYAMHVQACWALVASPSDDGNYKFSETISVGGRVVIQSSGQLDMKVLKTVMSNPPASGGAAADTNGVPESEAILPIMLGTENDDMNNQDMPPAAGTEEDTQAKQMKKQKTGRIVNRIIEEEDWLEKLKNKHIL